MKSEVELVSTGSELLSGRTVNTHAQALAEKIRPFGLRLIRDTTVPDQVDQIRDAVFAALCRVDQVFVSGGLGATSDDLTREALGRLTGRGLVYFPPALEELARRYAVMGRAVTDVARRQALILEASEGLLNPVGLAPGMKIDVGEEKTIWVLPGPPHEFLGVLEQRILPMLGKGSAPVFQSLEKVFMVCGLGESEIAERLEKIGLPAPDLVVGYCARAGETEIHLSAAPEHAAALAQKTAEIRRTLGDTIFAEEHLGLEAVVGRLLAAQHQTVAVAESCTGGLIGHRLTQIAGSSAYFPGGVIAYSNESKIRDLGVARELIERHGAVSEPVACAMAGGVRARFGADFGLAVTGIAGPDGGTADKPVGTVWLAVADAAGAVARSRRFPGVRAVIQYGSSQLALDLLRHRLQGR